MVDVSNRSRLMLSAGSGICEVDALQAALAAGDVASVILRDRSKVTNEFEEFCKQAIPIIQDAGAAAIIAEDSQLMGRSAADGLYSENGHHDIKDYVARFSPQNIVGCGGMFNRHTALIYGEANPDFLLFGKLGKDSRPEPHTKNLELASWWAEFVEIPGVVLGGSEVDSVVTASQTGADFVLLESAVFGDGQLPEKAVEHANDLLDKHAPDLSGAGP